MLAIYDYKVVRVLCTGVSERFRKWGGGTNLYEPYTIL